MKHTSGDTLFKEIDVDGITTLNELIPDSGKRVIKPWDERMSSTFVSSDSDQQLLMNIPFISSVKVFSLLLRCLDSGSAAKTVNLYANRPDLDFTSVEEVKPTQVIETIQSSDVVEYKLKPALWQNTRSITLFVKDNFGDSVTELYYIGLKGESRRLEGNIAATTIVYEAAANPADHKYKLDNLANIGLLQ